jgi:hypothetical protein
MPSVLKALPRHARLHRPSLAAMALALMFAASARGAHAQVMAQVNPVRYSLTAAPGVPLKRDLQVSNFGDVRVTVSVTLSDWTLDDDGELSLAPAGSMPQTLQGLVRFSPASLTLEPNESRWIHAEFELGNAGPPTRWGLLLCAVRPVGADTSARAKPAAQLATTVFLSRVPSDSIRAAMTGLDLQPLGGDSVRASAYVRNLGARQFDLAPRFTLADSSGVRMDGASPKPGVILPGRSRRVSWVCTTPLKPGRYAMTAAIDGAPDAASDRVTFAWPFVHGEVRR